MNTDDLTYALRLADHAKKTERDRDVMAQRQLIAARESARQLFAALCSADQSEGEARVDPVSALVGFLLRDRAEATACGETRGREIASEEASGKVRGLCISLRATAADADKLAEALLQRRAT